MSSRELTEDECALARQFVGASRAILAWTEIRTKARDQLCASLGEDAGLVNNELALTVSRTHPVRFALARFRKDNAALYAAYSTPAEAETVTLHTHAGLEVLGDAW